MTAGLARTRSSLHLFRIVQYRRCYSTRPPSVTLLGKEYPTDKTTNITSAIADKVGRNLYMNPSHPLGILHALVSSHFRDFNSMVGLPPVVTPAQNFDDLGFPPDHPGRAPTDSYYLNSDAMLRTHTSAHEVETFARGERRWLLSADVYRRDEIDASHYPVFHQMEGARVFGTGPSAAGRAELEADNARLAGRLARARIAIEDVPHVSPTNPRQAAHDPVLAELVAQNLKLSLNSLMLTLFGDRAGGEEGEPLRVRWIEAFFPFTTPSYEVEVFFRGKWLEILGCGVVQQRTLDCANVPDSISWAFGLGLERIAMILFSIPDIRLFWSQDPRFLSQFAAGQISTFKPYSKYPACYKDVSFWLSEAGLHDNDFCDLVRDTAGDLVQDVVLIDNFTHPKTKRSSKCYRINYCSMDRSLSNEEANEVHAQVIASLKDKFGVEIR